MIRSYPREKDKQSDSTKLNIQEKADLYIKSFPKYCPLQVFNLDDGKLLQSQFKLLWRISKLTEAENTIIISRL